ncbi:MAG: hypothetical protein ABFS41_07405 [Myxococcota bacterium]
MTQLSTTSVSVVDGDIKGVPWFDREALGRRAQLPTASETATALLVMFFELLGPVLTRLALLRSGETRGA